MDSLGLPQDSLLRLLLRLRLLLPDYHSFWYYYGHDYPRYYYARILA